jgi:hypothetical protein
MPIEGTEINRGKDRIFLTLSLFICLNLLAQEKTIYNHQEFWSKIELNEIFANKLGVGLDFVFRSKSELDNGNIFSSRLRESIRPWLHYQVGPNARLSFSPVGYMMTHDYIGKPADYLRPPYHEIRSTLQFFHHQKQLQGKLMHTWRYRYELRFQENPLNESYRQFNRFRFRYRIRYVINGNDFYANNTFYAAVSDEIGINFGENVVLNMFNQNRFYAGVGVRFMNAARVEVRYINRFRTRGTGFEYDHGQGIMIGLYIDQVSGLKSGKKSVPPVRFGD